MKIDRGAPVLFFNATVRTVDDATPSATWFTVLGERFQRVGSGPPPDVSQKIDLARKAVVPGFVDSHAHFFQTGLDLLFVDLVGVTTSTEVRERLERGARGKRSWIFASGYEEDSLTDCERITVKELDEWFPDRPVWMNRVDYHSAVANSAALRRLEVPAGTRGFLQDGGKPNGILRSEAYMYAKTRIARLYPVETRDRAVKRVAKLCSERGITAVHALEGGPLFGDEGVASVLKYEHSLDVDVTLFLQEKNPWLSTRMGFHHLGGCILVDGSIGSYTAALDGPYEGQPNTSGVLYEKPRELNTFVAGAHEMGVQLAFHAIGPRAIGLVLDAYEKALHKFPRYDHRHRIEHFELATDEQIKRARDLGVVVAMQPAFEYFWGGEKGMYASRLGSRWRQTNRLRDILDAGVRIAGGSDTNVTPPNPILGLHAAVNHPNPDQRVTPAEALRMMTLDAAYAGFNAHRHGSITPGKEASFVVLNKDPLSVKPEKIKDLKVQETWFEGRQVYSAPQ